jgi:hypothetical protein
MDRGSEGGLAVYFDRSGEDLAEQVTNAVK